VSGYREFARHYDAVMGDGAVNSGVILEAIARWRPETTRLLELGCGTGSVLAGLESVETLVGLDASAEMLEVAVAKVPRARFVLTDMSRFDLGERFDVVACVFDTLNHLSEFAQWVSCIECVAEHLEPGGLFVLDVNTVGRLEQLVDDPPWVVAVDGRTVTMEVVDAGESLVTWVVRVTEGNGEDVVEVEREEVQELGVELDLLRAALSASFEIVDEDDGFGERPSDDSRRAFFVARRRA
jgi:SAM-dependent methyltransferase